MTSGPFDVVIVGNGIAGLALAYEFSRCTRLRVALVAPLVSVKRAASAAAQGISAVKGLLVAREPLFKAKLSAHRYLPGWLAELEQAAGFSIPQQHGGVGELFKDLAGYQDVAGRVYQRRFQGAFAPEIGVFSSSINKSKSHGHLYPGDFWFDPVVTMKALEAAAIAGGVVRISGAVRSVHPEIRLDDGSRLQTRRVVLAAGSDTVAMLGQRATSLCDAPGWKEVPGETVVWSLAPGHFRQPLFEGATLTRVHSFVRGIKSITLTPSGDIVAGSWNENVADIRADFSRELDLFGFDGHGHAAVSRWGVRLRARDRAPVCGPVSVHPDEPVWIFTGFYKNGLQLAPLLASNVMAAITSDDPRRLPDEFSSLRFV